MRVVFVAAPFTDYASGRAVVAPDLQARLKRVHTHLATRGYQVVSAHEREEWGRRLDAPASALAWDLQAIDRCDVLVAFVGAPPSPGVQLEVGYAIATRTPIVAVAGADDVRPYLLEGLPAVVRSQVILARDGFDVLGAIDRALDELLAEPQAGAAGKRGR